VFARQEVVPTFFMFSFPGVNTSLGLIDLHHLLYHTSIEISVQLEFYCGRFIVGTAFTRILYCARELAQSVDRED
jgi:hypothetical protein